MSIKLNQLRDVLAVARLGGIRPAARELSLAQPSLTKSIQQLEAELGVPLFERSGRGLRLTPYGAAFVARTQGAFNEIHRAQDEVRQLRDAHTGHLSFAMAGISMMNLLPGALHSFQQRHSGVLVRVVERPYDQAIPELRSGEIEFAVLPEPGESLGDEFVAQPLLADRYVVVGRRGHPLASRTTLAGLHGAGWIVTRQRGLRAAQFESLFQQQDLPVPRVEIHCESIIGVLALLATTDLLAVLPERWLHTPTVRNVCVALSVPDFGAATPTCIVRRAAYPLTPAAVAFVAALEVEARALVHSRPEPEETVRASRPVRQRGVPERR